MSKFPTHKSTFFRFFFKEIRKEDAIQLIQKAAYWMNKHKENILDKDVQIAFHII